MPQPTAKEQHINAALSAVSMAYRNQLYIADRVFPLVPVSKQSDYYFIYLKGSWFRDEAALRAPGSKARRGGYALSKDQYFCSEYAFAKEITDEDRANADDALEPEITAVEFATDKVALKKERLVAASCMNASNWTSSSDAEGGWAAGEGNTFITDVETAIGVVRGLTGFEPNVMLMDDDTFRQIRQEDSVLERIKYGGTNVDPARVTARMIAAVFGLEEVLVGKAIYSSASEKADGSDFNGVDIWEVNPGKGSALLYYRPSAPGRKIPSAGYTYTWTKHSQAIQDQAREAGQYRVVRMWREESEHQDVVEASECFDPKVTGADLGYLFYNTFSS